METFFSFLFLFLLLWQTITFQPKQHVIDSRWHFRLSCVEKNIGSRALLFHRQEWHAKKKFFFFYCFSPICWIHGECFFFLTSCNCGRSREMTLTNRKLLPPFKKDLTADSLMLLLCLGTCYLCGLCVRVCSYVFWMQIQSCCRVVHMGCTWRTHHWWTDCSSVHTLTFH